MSADLRGVVYPLAAVHQRERWALDALQADMALAVQRVSASADACTQLQERHQRAASAGMPAVDAAIDPSAAQARLLYLADLQQRLGRCREGHAALERAQERVRDASRRQQVKLETIERHRVSFFRDAAAEQERQRNAEVDRDWLARSQWRRGFAPVARHATSVAAVVATSDVNGQATEAEATR